MIKVIKRISDNKYLQSVENDVWVDDVKDAYEMTYRECESAKVTLLNTYSTESIKEIVNLKKNKPISREEYDELLALLKNKQ
jgi:ribonuclease PH